MRAGIDGGFQQKAARRPNNTAAIVVCLVNLILRGSLSRQVSTFVRPFDTYTEARCSANFLVRSINNLRLLIRQVSSFVR